MAGNKLTFRVHALQRMFQKNISDVRTVLTAGGTIEDYPEDIPYPSRLMLGWSGKRPLHVVAAVNTRENETIVITAYEPDAARWEPGFKRRRR